MQRLQLYVFTMIHIRRMSSSCFGSQVQRLLVCRVQVHTTVVYFQKVICIATLKEFQESTCPKRASLFTFIIDERNQNSQSFVTGRNWEGVIFLIGYLYIRFQFYVNKLQVDISRWSKNNQLITSYDFLNSSHCLVWKKERRKLWFCNF